MGGSPQEPVRSPSCWKRASFFAATRSDTMRCDKASSLRAGLIAAVLLGGPPIASAQTGGTLQYPPSLVGGDAQPYTPGAQPNKAVPSELDKGISGGSG